MTAASLAQLEHAAEKTIACAASAMLWAGDDRYGVLAHFAGCRAASLAECRHTYIRLCAARQRNSIDERRFADKISRLEALEFAALPGDAVPQWDAIVEQAVRESRAAVSTEAASMWGPMDFASGAEAVRFRGLYVCSLWSNERLLLNVLDHCATFTVQTADQCVC